MDDECFDDIYFDGIKKSKTRPHFSKSKYGLPLTGHSSSRSKAPMLLKLSDLTQLGITLTQYANGCTFNSRTRCWEDNDFNVDLSGFEDNDGLCCDGGLFDSFDDFDISVQGSGNLATIKNDNTNIPRHSSFPEYDHTSEKKHKVGNTCSSCTRDRTSVESESDGEIDDNDLIWSDNADGVSDDVEGASGFLFSKTTGDQSLVSPDSVTDPLTLHGIQHDRLTPDISSETQASSEEEDWDEGFEGDLNMAHVEAVRTHGTLSLPMSFPNLASDIQKSNLKSDKQKNAINPSSRARTTVKHTAPSWQLSSRTAGVPDRSNKLTRIPMADSTLTGKRNSTKGKGPTLIRPEDMRMMQSGGVLRGFLPLPLGSMPGTAPLNTPTDEKEFSDWDLDLATGGDLEVGLDWDTELLSECETRSQCSSVGPSISASSQTSKERLERMKEILDENESPDSETSGSSRGQMNAEGTHSLTNFTRTSASEDFELDSSLLAIIKDSEETHKIVMREVAGTTWTDLTQEKPLSSSTHNNSQQEDTTISNRSNSGRGRMVRKGSPGPKPGLDRVLKGNLSTRGVDVSPAEKTLRNKERDSKIPVPSWLKESGPVMAMHDVELGRSTSISPVRQSGGKRSTATRGSMGDTVGSGKGLDMLTNAKLSKTRRKILKNIWTYASEC
mmetsp:Transcript_3999/g.4086  ORF Transcript_3999/g.4086 Transcript_3999/m.4086 type:complete len:669 (-) Transcript_3999:692-2698(-)